ncbi:hypothetical protein H4R34_004355 [Dimargaris verticillata]|uniref:Uncharacterized protein n=1 Tax=Dimargaris verticillata TaxID=2761393 RepID=A0A9W8EBS3_9FUNG|nr:hypothetical protein H4R34_004355 [Dimargaris verticillata]
MRYGITLLLLAAVAMAQPALPDAPGSDATNVGMEKLSIQENPGQPPLATIDDLPLEMLAETLKQNDPMDLQAILPTNHQFYGAAAIALGPELQVIGAQYLDDPTVPEEDKQRYRDLQQLGSSAAPAMFNGYFWQHLKFRLSHGLFSIPWGENPSQNHITADVVLDELSDGAYELCWLYLRTIPTLVPNNDETNPTPPGSLMYPDIYAGLPLVAGTNYQDLNYRLLRSFYPSHPDISEVETGYIGAFNKGYVMEISAQVEKYLEVIDQADLLSSLEARQDELVYDIIANHIAHNDPVRARYFFNDIVAFQVIPELIAAHVVTRYYNQALVLIDRMQNNPYLSAFRESVIADIDLNYYELAVYVALELTMDENADDFVKQVIQTHKLLEKGLV